MKIVKESKQTQTLVTMASDGKEKMQVDDENDKAISSGASSVLDNEARTTVNRLRAIKGIKFGVDRFFTIDPASCICLVHSLEISLLKKLNLLIEEQLANMGVVDRDCQETYNKMKDLPTYDHDPIKQPGLIWEEECESIQLQATSEKEVVTMQPQKDIAEIETSNTRYDATTNRPDINPLEKNWDLDINVTNMPATQSTQKDTYRILKKTQNQPSNQPLISTPTNATKQARSSQLKTIESMQEKNYAAQTEGFKTTFRCYNCSGYGHIAKHCKKPRGIKPLPKELRDKLTQEQKVAEPETTLTDGKPWAKKRKTEKKSHKSRKHRHKYHKKGARTTKRKRERSSSSSSSLRSSSSISSSSSSSSSSDGRRSRRSHKSSKSSIKTKALSQKSK